MVWSRSTYFLSTSTANRKFLLQNARFAELFVDSLLQHRKQGRFALHSFVIMPDHVHLLLTPGEEVTLERAAQFVKGTFSFRLKKEAGFAGEIWSSGYYDERIRSPQRCYEVMAYIERNPVVRGLSMSPKAYPFGSASLRWPMDAVPQWLKPPCA